MATLTIRELRDDVYERLREQAQRHARSIEAEAVHVLGENLPLTKVERSVGIDALIEQLRKNALPMPPGMDSVSLIRAIRDEA